MQLNIKSDETYRLATRLAELTGESRTTAVTEALREKVSASERERDVEERVKRILAIAAEMRAEMVKDGKPIALNINDLYDEITGLPV